MTVLTENLLPARLSAKVIGNSSTAPLSSMVPSGTILPSMSLLLDESDSCGTPSVLFMFQRVVPWHRADRCSGQAWRRRHLLGDRFPVQGPIILMSARLQEVLFRNWQMHSRSVARKNADLGRTSGGASAFFTRCWDDDNTRKIRSRRKNVVIRGITSIPKIFAWQTDPEPSKEVAVEQFSPEVLEHPDEPVAGLWTPPFPRLQPRNEHGCARKLSRKYSPTR